jgi:hypothetical protein
MTIDKNMDKFIEVGKKADGVSSSSPEQRKLVKDVCTKGRSKLNQQVSLSCQGGENV